MRQPEHVTPLALRGDVVVGVGVGAGHLRVTPETLHLVVVEPGRAAGRGVETIDCLDRLLGDIGLVRPPVRPLVRRGQLAGQASLPDRSPVRPQACLGSGKLVMRGRESHVGRGGVGDGCTGVGPHPRGRLLRVDLHEAKRHTQRHRREPDREVVRKGGVEDGAGVGPEPCRLAAAQRERRLDAMVRNEDVVEYQRLGTRASETGDEPVVDDLVVGSGHHREVRGGRSIEERVWPRKPENGPGRVVTATRPAERARQTHPAVGGHRSSQRCDRRRDECPRIVIPHLVLEFVGHDRDEVRVLCEQADRPGRRGAALRDVHHRRGVDLGQLLGATEASGLKSPRETRVVEQGHVLIGDRAEFLGTRGVAGDHRHHRSDLAPKRPS